jgi:hypothetical protein
VAADALKLQFDSAWQTSGDQTGEITVQYGNGPETTVLTWHSNAADPNFHATNHNETVNVDLDNPANATSAIVRFKYTGTDNWFWAIDNIRIGTAAVALSGDFNSDGRVDAADYVVWRNGLGTTHTQADYNLWRANFGRAVGSGAALSTGGQQSVPTPEPTTAWMCLMALVVVLGRAPLRVAAKRSCN